MSDSAYLFDSNIWVAMMFDAHPAHARALHAFAQTSAMRPACFCRATQLSFLRLATTPAILTAYGVPAMTNADALQTFDELSKHEHVEFRHEPAGIEALWPKLGNRSTASHNLWMDAYLAAFAITGGLKLITTDRGFKQFEELEVVLLGKA